MGNKIITALLIFLLSAGMVFAQTVKFVEDDIFDIKSSVEKVNENSFYVAGELVAYDAATADLIRDKGGLNTGDTVRISGKIKNGIKIADKIEIISRKNVESEAAHPLDNVINAVRELFTGLSSG